MRTFRLACLVLFAVLCAREGDARAWTSAGGQQLNAEFEKVLGATVFLKKPDGAVVTIPMYQLCEADQAEIKQILSAKQAATSDAAATQQEPKEAVSTASARPALTPSGQLGDKEIAELKTEYVDQDKGVRYVFSGGIAARTPTESEKRKYIKSGEVPYRILMGLYVVKEVRGRQLSERLDGTARFYVMDSEGNVLVKRTESLAKMCPS